MSKITKRTKNKMKPQKQTNKFRGLSLRANHTDRRFLAKLVPTFVARGYRVVSAMENETTTACLSYISNNLI
jgi:hypothetical protein